MLKIGELSKNRKKGKNEGGRGMGGGGGGREGEYYSEEYHKNFVLLKYFLYYVNECAVTRTLSMPRTAF